MKTLLALVLLAAFVHAQEISQEDIAATVRHMQAIVRAQTGELAEEKQAHEAAETRLMELQGKIEGVTKDRNDQAARGDQALDQLDAANARLAVLAKKVWQLKIVVCTAGATIAGILLVMMGLPGRAMPWGIVATLAIVAGVFGGLWAMI